MRLSGRKALVTGASGGIGSAIVARLKAEGATVAGADIQLDAAAVDVALPGNLTNNEYCDGLPKAAFDALGGLDLLVNNAGIIRRGKITDVSDDDFDISMAVNVESPFRLCRSAIPIMAAKGGGSIVNVASCWGQRPGPNHPIYCASKAAIASMTQCMAMDHAGQGIRINAVCPNEVDTPMLRNGFAIRGLDPDKGIEELAATVPIGRVAVPTDIADVVVFLASDDASYMCGALVEVNGGKPIG